MYCYYTKILITNTVIPNRAKLQLLSTTWEHFSCLSRANNYLFFPGPISQAIVNMNYLHHSAVFADTIFAHVELIRVFLIRNDSWKPQTWTLATHSRSYAESAKFVKGLCSCIRFSGYIAACRCTGITLAKYKHTWPLCSGSKRRSLTPICRNDNLIEFTCLWWHFIVSRPICYVKFYHGIESIVLFVIKTYRYT